MTTLHTDATDTEVEAHDKITQSIEHLRLEVLRALVAGEGSGSEIADRTGIDLLNVRPRLTELVDYGHAADTGIRRKNIRGNNERVIKATSTGISLVMGSQS